MKHKYVLAILGFGVQSQIDSHHILRGSRHLLTMTKQLSKVSLSQFLVLSRFIQHRWKTILLSKGGKTGKRSWHKSERMKNKKKKKAKQWRLARRRKKTGKTDGKEKELKEENKASETERARERERVTCVWDFFKNCVHSSLGAWWCGTSMIQQSFRFFNFSTSVKVSSRWLE